MTTRHSFPRLGPNPRVITADPSETTANSQPVLSPKEEREREREFFLPPSLSRRLEGQSLGGYRLSPSAARLLLSRIGGIYNTRVLKNQNGDRAAGKITQVGSILEEKQSLR